MFFQYIPTKGFIIDSLAFEFGESRSSIRLKLGANFKIEDRTIDLSSSENNKTIYQRRDIYVNINSSENYFFLGYDQDDLLKDVEIHYCDKIKIFEFQFDFNQSIDFIASRLKIYSKKNIKKQGEYFFEDLKIVILNKKEMGGNGNTLGYFYCTRDVSHLTNFY